MNNKEFFESTVPMMLSDDYKERFRAEYYQLFRRYEGLSKMMRDRDNDMLGFEPTCDKFVYRLQLNAMENYLVILAVRAEKEDIDISFTAG